eukprot:CAMPEP_0181138382 /NCGR_PEP_ID=MMETSP1071-20121207/34215_1 /TAXON_ID=35127 /ORGANISM="Thalassiosira sp., Strain NH16" /LENGTH=500 /DNA_ID=CAMNT_0023225211 /DNA_START=34 /DNA_END=1536 /DNA_ORIENTATION=+
MVSKQALETIEPALDTIDGIAAVVPAAAPLKIRVSTSVSVCSVATEKGAPEARDAGTIESRGTDGSRDIIDDFLTPDTPNSTAPCAPMITNEEVAVSREATPSNEEFDDSSSGCSCSPLPLLTRAGDNIDSVLQHFYSSIEIGAAKVFSSPCQSSGDMKEDNSPDATPNKTAAELLAASADADDTKNNAPEKQPSERNEPRQPSGDAYDTNKKTGETQPGISNAMSQDTPSIRTQCSAKTNNTQETLNSLRKKNVEVLTVGLQSQAPNAPTGCCLGGVFACSGGEGTGSEKGPGSPLSDIIGDTLKDITAERVHILDTFSDDNTYESEAQISSDFVTPKAQTLLNEIEDMEHSFHEVRKSATMEKIAEIKKRQDPYIQKMVSIKHHLQEQQELLKSAPEDIKKDYYCAISRAAILNAEVETSRAELELKKIRLESMRVQEEMDRMVISEGTFDSTGGSLMTDEDSTEGLDGAFDVFARYAVNKFLKLKKHKAQEENTVTE